MHMKKCFCFPFLGLMLTAASCESIDSLIRIEDEDSPSGARELVSLQDVAVLLSSAGLEKEHVGEVYDAVSQSRVNGYDEEYTMKDLFECPGTGVGQDKSKAGTDGKEYPNPLRELFERYYASSSSKTRAGTTANDYLDYISGSDMQIYWPYSEKWDGKTMPVITFDPRSEARTNVGWEMGSDGTLKEVSVSEDMAQERPVWVINRNDDASFTSLEMLRQSDPHWSEGGSLVIKSKVGAAASSGVKTLVLKDFTMMRNYDGWFAGASEFFIKIASIDAFTASTEAEMYLYNPSVTDFMVVVKRNQVGKPQELNTVLVSEWTSQLQSCAFMIIEDDGGTRTSWDCSAVVKYESKSYGFEVKIPYNSRDDIVWRGSLGRKYIEATNDLSGWFGDVQIVFSIVDL